MQPLQPDSITLDTVTLALHGRPGLQVDVLRLDKIHPLISGNKWFKISRYIGKAILQHATCLVSFGGAYSNHLLAVAAAGKMNGLKTIGIVRGEPAPVLSPTLSDCTQLGMDLQFVSRGAYRDRLLPAIVKNLNPPALIIPAGGYGTDGASGAEAILGLVNVAKYTHIYCATGTGTMLAGLVAGSQGGPRCTGIAVTAGNVTLRSEINQLLPSHLQDRFGLLNDYAFRGFAKYDQTLIGFMNFLYQTTGIPSDFVYTGKLFFAVADLAARAYFPADARVLIIHSGGLQGNRSLPAGSLRF